MKPIKGQMGQFHLRAFELAGVILTCSVFFFSLFDFCFSKHMDPIHKWQPINYPFVVVLVLQASISSRKPSQFFLYATAWWVKKKWVKKKSVFFYHNVRWYATLENKTPAETFPKCPLVLCVRHRSDRNPPITATSVTFGPSLRHESYGRFFESHVSTKTVVISYFHKRF